MSRESKIESFISELKQKLELASQATVPKAPHFLLKTVLSKCGWKKCSDENLHLIQRKLHEHRISAEPSLTSPQLTRTEWIYFRRVIPRINRPARQAETRLYRDEEALRTMLLDHMGRLPALRNLETLNDGKEYKLKDGKQIDLLCKDKKTGEYVVIELKTGDPDQKVVGQIGTYMKGLKKEPDKQSAGVRGIIISGQPDLGLREYLREKEPTVEWFCYRRPLLLPLK